MITGVENQPLAVSCEWLTRSTGNEIITCMLHQADFLHCHQPGMVDNDRERREREKRGEREGEQSGTGMEREGEGGVMKGRRGTKE